MFLTSNLPANVWLDIGKLLEDRGELTKQCSLSTRNADAGSVVALSLEERGHGKATLRNDRRRIGLQHTELPDARRIPSGQYPVAGRRAVGRSRVGIGKSDALRREAVDVGRLERRILAVARRLAIAEVIEQDEDNIGLGFVGPKEKRKEECPEGKRCFCHGRVFIPLAGPKTGAGRPSVSFRRATRLPYP